MDEKKNNWAHRRKKALEKLGDNILHSAESIAATRQHGLRERLIREIEKELDGITDEALKEAVISRFLKAIPEKPLAVMIDVAIEKIAKKISQPSNPF